MNLETGIEAATMETAVLGGAIFGCGGGGKLEDGLCLSETASAQITLLSLEMLPAQHSIAVIAPRFTSAILTERINPTQADRAFKNLKESADVQITHLLNGGCGAVESLLGWELAASQSLPLLDGVMPADHHPCMVENLLRHQRTVAPERSFWMAWAGAGADEAQVWYGRPSQLLTQLLQLTDHRSCAVAAGPFRLSDLPRQLQAGAMTESLQVGREIVAIDRPTGEEVSGLLGARLAGAFSTFATVTEIVWTGDGRDATGTISLRDVDGRSLQLIYGYRYQQLRIDGRLLAQFPACIITLGIFGTPITGEELFVGQDLYLLAKPQETACGKG
jgi:DUF917 family protein